jgi:hypothetical protein
LQSRKVGRTGKVTRAGRVGDTSMSMAIVLLWCH